jgi:HEAT repeat protein
MEIAEDLKAAKDIIQSFLKAKKTLRMYPQNNPVYIKMLDDCFSRFTEFFQYGDNFKLNIRQYEVVYEEEVLYKNRGKEDNLALFFFKDGLREINFQKGMTQEEMTDFLRIMSLDFEKEYIDDDLVTLFWEKDFQNIRYVVDEAFLTDEEDYESRAMTEMEEKKTDPDNIRQAYLDASQAEENIREVAIISLSDKDLKALFQYLQRDTQDKTPKLSDILFEIFYSAETAEELADTSLYLMHLLEYSVRHGYIHIMAEVLRRVQQINSDSTVDGARRRHAEKIRDFAGTRNIIRLMGDLLDSGQDIDEALINEYIVSLDINSIHSLLWLLGELESIRARKILIESLVHQGAKDITTLSRGLKDERWYVVRNVIYILRKIGDKKAISAIIRTISHADIRVKKEVFKALGSLGGSNVLSALKDSLNDPLKQARSAALNALAQIGSEPARKAIIDHITDRRFRDMGMDEKKEFFEVLSQWKDNENVYFLVQTLNKKAFWKRAKNFENRACAAYSLGLIGSSTALPDLNKVKDSGNRLLKEYTRSAIERIEHGTG